MRYTTTVMALFIPLMLAACGTPPQHTAKQEPATPYAAAILDRPQPPNEAARAQECDWLQSQIASQRGQASFAFAAASDRRQASAYITEAQQRIAALQSRFAEIGCNKPAATLPAK